MSLLATIVMVIVMSLLVNLFSVLIISSVPHGRIDYKPVSELGMLKD